MILSFFSRKPVHLVPLLVGFLFACGGVAPGQASARPERSSSSDPSSSRCASPVTRGTPFAWKGLVAKGLAVEVRAKNGSIEAEPASGPEVEVTAEARGPAWIRMRESERGISFTVVRNVEDDGGCGEASPDASSESAEPTVDFVVHLPASVRFNARTINGAVTARSLLAADVRTTNGKITLASVVDARAHAVNGSIQASLVSAAKSADLTTVNGSIDVTLPREGDADVVAETVHGSVTSTFPLSGTWSSRRVKGTIGHGGSELRLKTVNGRIRIEPLG